MPESPLHIGFLTRNRPDSIMRALISCMATVDVPHLITIAVDNDPETSTYLGENIDERLRNAGLSGTPHVRLVLLQNRHYYVRGLNALYQLMREYASDRMVAFDTVAFFNDDMTFQTGWASRALQQLATFPDGVGLVDCGESFVAATALFDQYFDRMPAQPCYTMYCSDSELFLRCRAMNRYIRHPNSGIIHHSIPDALRTETLQWSPLDHYIFSLRAQQFGWTDEQTGQRTSRYRLPDPGTAPEH